MKQDVTFAKMKLTNNKTPEGDQVVLSSMHKYHPRLVVTPQDGMQEPQIFSFPETQFIAVTAYQNTTVSKSVNFDIISYTSCIWDAVMNAPTLYYCYNKVLETAYHT